MIDERVTYNGAWLNEIVADAVTVHIEALSVHDFMIRIYRPERIVDHLRQDAVDIHLNVRDLTEVSAPEGLPVFVGPRLTWCMEWTDRFGQRHACTVKHYIPVNSRTVHRCECGSCHRGP